MSPIVIPDLGEFTAPPSGSDTATAADILREAQNHLLTGVRVERDKLNGAVSADATTLTSTYARGGIKAGAKLSVDLEDYHVWAVSSFTVTVQPGEFGSTSAAHVNGSIIHVNAEFTPFEVFTQINNELKSLSAPTTGLFAPQSVTLTYNAARYGYDLTSVDNIDGIVSVLAEVIGSEKTWVPVPYRIERNMPTADFASGYALFVGEGWPGRDIRVVYRGQFSPLTALTNDVETVTGLPNSCFDILAMGAAIRCAAPTEIDRNQMGSQASGRRSNEVPAGARLNAIRGLVSLRQQRISEERARMARQFPWRLPRRHF